MGADQDCLWLRNSPAASVYLLSLVYFNLFHPQLSFREGSLGLEVQWRHLGRIYSYSHLVFTPPNLPPPRHHMWVGGEGNYYLYLMDRSPELRDEGHSAATLSIF